MIQEKAQSGDLVVAAIVGFAGIAPVLAAVECGCSIALANKESLVSGGQVVLDAVAKAGVSLLPVDSEHSA
ncbi:MAG TPA: 1-deoxy-D-xylulose-5-phosphate reductoisomerase, partial [Phycisphaerales bacterium]|nr:1-deoxy-D-xylulose-5-phosphate reductoisomerase [Phycisphaerales bacterium]